MIINDDCVTYMKDMKDNSIDSIVTDPPYNLGFMEKNWDKTGIAFDIEVWQECLRILKPGGFLLSFSSVKNYHKMATSIEYAGFIIKDVITWNYSSGMPKGQDIAKAIESKIINGSANTRDFKKLDGVKGTTSLGYNKMKKEQDVRPNNYNNQEYNKEVFLHTEEAQKWDEWKTQLKPAIEFICVAQKPLSEKTFAENVLKWGVGAFNIDACRIPHNEPVKTTTRKPREDDILFNGNTCGFKSENLTMASPNPKGRYPSNVILDEETANYLDKTYGNHKSGSNCVRKKEGTFVEHNGLGKAGDVQTTYGDEGGISRFYYTVENCADRFIYCAKASKKEKGSFNFHTTVKPIKLMEYLVKLVTPPNGIVLDPFMGSGTTGIACKKNGFEFIGIEKEREYYDIAERRINNARIL